MLSDTINGEMLSESIIRLIQPEISPCVGPRQVHVSRLVNELSVMGWPALRVAADRVLHWDWAGEAEREKEQQAEGQEDEATCAPQGWGPLYLSAPLKSALERALSGVEREASDQGPVFEIDEEDHLIEQLHELLNDLELKAQRQKLGEVETLRVNCWVAVTRWLLVDTRDQRDEHTRRVLASASKRLGDVPVAHPPRFVAKAVTLLVDELRACRRGGGHLRVTLPGLHDVGGRNSLRESALLADLRGVERLEIEGYGALGWLGIKVEHTQWFQEWGEEELASAIPLGLADVAEIDIHNLWDEELMSLDQAGLLMQVYKGTSARPVRGRLASHLCEKIKEAEHADILKAIALRSGSAFMEGYFEDQLVMRAIPAGRFWMGYNRGYSIEGPRHRVQITRPFLMGATVLTQGQWVALMGSKPSEIVGGFYPMVRITWYDCVRICNTLSELDDLEPVYQIGEGDRPEVGVNLEANGYRLATEAEWTYAAKAGCELGFSGSNNLNDVAQYDRYGVLPLVGSKRPNCWGVYDMAGMCGQWCNDSMRCEPYHRRASGAVDPMTYDLDTNHRIIRSRRWAYETENRISLRCDNIPISPSAGLRLVRSL